MLFGYYYGKPNLRHAFQKNIPFLFSGQSHPCCQPASGLTEPAKALTCMGETAAAGGVFRGLGLSGVRGIVAPAGLGTREEESGSRFISNGTNILEETLSTFSHYQVNRNKHGWRGSCVSFCVPPGSLDTFTAFLR